MFGSIVDALSLTSVPLTLGLHRIIDLAYVDLMLIARWVAVLLVIMAFASCDRGSSSAPPGNSGSGQPQVAPRPPAADAALDACAKLSRAECLASDTCTLHHAHGTIYDCLPDRSPCEIGIRQEDKAACEAKAACTWKIANCYCPCTGSYQTRYVAEPEGGCGCACGGGPPAMCVDRT